MFVAELEHPRFSEFNLTSLRTGIVGGAPCPPELVQRVMERMHCPGLLIGYGMTEASPITHLTAPEDPRPIRLHTVGYNLPHQEVKIINSDNGRTLPQGEVGEVCFRGYHIAKGGYYGEPEATADAIDGDGWLHSGDLGARDENGYVCITGRRKAGLAHFKVPRYIWLVEGFPMTGSGKLLKVAMREEALARLKGDGLSKGS